MLNIYHPPAHYSFHLSLSAWFQLLRLSQLQYSSAHLQFPIPDVVITIGTTPIIGPFIFRVLGFLIL